MNKLRGETLAFATLDYIRDHPEEWAQDTYYGYGVCGTTACFAGHVIMLARGRRLTGDELKDIPEDAYPEYVGPIGVAVRRLLGWSASQAHAVFYDTTRDFTELELQVKKVLNGEIA